MGDRLVQDLLHGERDDGAALGGEEALYRARGVAQVVEGDEAGFAKTTTIGGSIYGGNGTTSGAVEMAAIETINLGGSLYGGSAHHSGSIRATIQTIAVLIIHGDVRGSNGSSSGSVENATVLSAPSSHLGGAVIPGTGANSGKVS